MCLLPAIVRNVPLLLGALHLVGGVEGNQVHFDGVFQCLVDYFFSRHPNLGKLGLTKGRIYAIHE